MSTEIPSHFSVHEINQHKLDVEYKHWISRLDFFEVEFDFYEKLLYSPKFQKTETWAEISALLPKMREENREILEKVYSYRNNLEGYRECEDLECDIFYLNDHEKFRVILEQYAADIRKFKANLFKSLTPQL